MIHLEHKNNVILIITTLFQVTFSEPSSKLTRCISDFPGAFKLASHDFYFIFKACQFLTSKATHSLSVICYATLPSSYTWPSKTIIAKMQHAQNAKNWRILFISCAVKCISTFFIKKIIPVSFWISAHNRDARRRQNIFTTNQWIIVKTIEAKGQKYLWIFLSIYMILFMLENRQGFDIEF